MVTKLSQEKYHTIKNTIERLLDNEKNTNIIMHLLIDEKIIAIKEDTLPKEKNPKVNNPNKGKYEFFSDRILLSCECYFRIDSDVGKWVVCEYHTKEMNPDL